MKAMSFSGTFTALVTPMAGDGTVDFGSLEALVAHQLASSIDGLVLLGTTAETATLRPEEQLAIIKQVKQWAQGKLPLIVGGCTNDTRRTTEWVSQLATHGADGLLLVAPYYNKPSQAGLLEHFSTVATATKLPILLYSVPSRCGIEIGIETLAQLKEHCPHIMGLKESSGSIDRVSQILQAVGPEFSILSGDDTATLPFIAMGAHGVVSVAANWIPDGVSALIQAALAGDFTTARCLHARYFPAFKALLSLDTNPVPIKQVLFDHGLIRSPQVRLPLCPMNAEGIAKSRIATAANGVNS